MIEALPDRLLNGRDAVRLAIGLLDIVEPRSESTVTPLLVTLYLDEAVQQTNTTGHRDQPQSVPELVVSYVRRLHAIDPDTAIDAAQKMARLSIGNNWIPGDFKRSDAEVSDEMIKSLVQAGLLIEHSYGKAKFLRFTLDPVAECLAAIELCDELGSNESAWEKTITILHELWFQKKDIRGFLVALTDSIRSYAQPFRLPNIATQWAAKLSFDTGCDTGSSADKSPNPCEMN